MATRTVTVGLNADVSGFTAALGKAQAATSKFAADTQAKAGKALDVISKHEPAMERVGTSLTRMGTVGAAALAGVSKAAIDWESSWAGVTKTVDGSEAELSKLQDKLRNMAKTLPASHQEIAAVAEAAGQLGVSTGDVSAFTETMINLGETTNLSAEEAATTLARFSNIMGTSTSDVDKLGSVIVDLGNNFATTEGEIAAMALRLAGAGNQLGLSESDVFAFSAALSSVGIEAEAGGTAISQFMITTSQQVAEGGEQLEVLAETAGMSAGEFKTAFEQDAAGAMAQFLTGLGDVQASGQDTNVILEELGVTGIRQADALRRLASSGDLLTDALATGETAWEQNIALVEEATKRYGTTESQIKIAWNNIKDAAITAGEALLPVIASIADSIAGVAQAFANMPDGAQKVLVGAGIIVTAAALIGGAMLRILPAIAQARRDLTELANASPKAARGLGKVQGAMRKVGKVAGAMGAAAAAGATLGAVVANFQPSPAPVVEYENALLALAEGGDGAADAMNRLLDEGVWGEGGTQVTDLSTAFKQAKENMNIFNETLTKVGDALGGMKSSQRQVLNQFEAMDTALTGMDTEDAAKAFQQIADAAAKAEISNEELLDIFPKYKAQLQSVANQLGVTSLETEDYVKWMRGEVPDAVLKAAKGNEEVERSVNRVAKEMMDAKEAAAEYAQQMQENAEAALASVDAEAAWQQSIDDHTKSLEENGRTLDLNTQEGRDNWQQIRRLIQAGEEKIQNAKDQGVAGEDLRKIQSRVREEIERQAKEYNATDEQIRKMTQSMREVPKKVTTKTSAPGAKATKKQAEEITRELKKIDDADTRAYIISKWENDGYKEAKKAINNITGKTVYINLQPQYLTPTGKPPAFGGPVVTSWHADGGPIPGNSPHARADDVLIAATSDEFMMRRAAHYKYGTDTLQAINEGRIDAGALSQLARGYADGGAITQGRPSFVPQRTVTVTEQVRAGGSTNNYFSLPNVNPYAALIAAGHRIEGVR